MNGSIRNIEVPAIVNGRTIGTGTFTVTVTETLTEVIATVNYGDRLIGQIGFNAGTGFENVMATIQNLLLPEPFVRRS